MSKPVLFSLVTLLAAPALALEVGTYPVSSASGGAGEAFVSAERVELSLNGPDRCEIAVSGPILRGPEGVWASLVGSSAAQCVLIGTLSDFSALGDGCGGLVTGSCQIAGLIGPAREVTPEAPTASAPVRFTAPLLNWRFEAQSSADRVRIQAFLADQGYYNGALDGVYGPGTQAAIVAQLQAMADRGEPVDGNSAVFLSELMTELAGRGRALSARSGTPAAPNGSASGEPVYVGRWSCGGTTYAFTVDRYQLINEYDRSVMQEGRLRPDLVDGRTAYLELVGYGNLTFDGIGRRDMVMHDPSTAETWDCTRR